MVEPYPSEKYEFVNWDDDIPNIWENKHVPNHQSENIVTDYFLSVENRKSSSWLALAVDSLPVSVQNPPWVAMNVEFHFLYA